MHAQQYQKTCLDIISFVYIIYSKDCAIVEVVERSLDDLLRSQEVSLQDGIGITEFLSEFVLAICDDVKLVLFGPDEYSTFRTTAICFKQLRLGFCLKCVMFAIRSLQSLSNNVYAFSLA